MTTKVKEFFTFLVAFILVGTISYTGVHLYGSMSHYGGFSLIPLTDLKDLSWRVGPIFLILFLSTVLLLISKGKEPSEAKKPISVPHTNLARSNFYSLDLPEDPRQEEAVPEKPPVKPKDPVPKAPEPEKTFTFKSSQVFARQPEPVQARPKPAPRPEPKPEPAREVNDERRIFSDDLTPEEIDYLNLRDEPDLSPQKEAHGTEPSTVHPQQVVYPPGSSIQYIPVYTQPIIYQDGIAYMPMMSNGQQPQPVQHIHLPDHAGAPLPQAPKVEQEAVQAPLVQEPAAPQPVEVPEERYEEERRHQEEELQEAREQETDQNRPREAPIRPEPSAPYTPPPDSRFTEDRDFYERLQQEVEYSNKKKYEVSLIILNLEPRRFTNDFSVFDESVREFFDESAFIFEYVQSNTFAIILPFFSFFETQKELLNLYDHLKKELIQRSTSFRAGYTSKFNRYVDSETILYETEVAFKKAQEENEFCVLGFEPDVNKYEQYYT